MGESIRTRAAPLAIAALLLGAGNTASAARTNDTAPCEAPTGTGTGTISSDEARVVRWLVEKILTLDAYADPVIDIDADQVEDATGVDAQTIDAGRVREAAIAKLRAAHRWGDVRVRPAESRAAANGSEPLAPVDSTPVVPGATSGGILH